MITLKKLTINYLYIVNLSTGTVIISSNNAIKQNFVFCDCGASLDCGDPAPLWNWIARKQDKTSEQPNKAAQGCRTPKSGPSA